MNRTLLTHFFGAVMAFKNVRFFSFCFVFMGQSSRSTKLSLSWIVLFFLRDCFSRHAYTVIAFVLQPLFLLKCTSFQCDLPVVVRCAICS